VNHLQRLTIALLLIIGVGCGGNWLGRARPIQDIRQSAAVDTTVYLKGQVSDRVPLVSGQVYQLQDETGTIWVLTEHPIPQSGQQLMVKGWVRYQSIPLAGQDYGETYIEEQERWRDDE
jgi:hypothetical protein